MKKFIVGTIAALMSFVVPNKVALISSPIPAPKPALSAPRFIVLQARSYGVAVSVLQRILIQEGFLALKPESGYFGAATEKALKAYQKAHNLPQTGTFTIPMNNLPAFFSSAHPSFTPLKTGASGSQVTSTQKFLIKSGHLKSSAATGYFGSTTRAGLKAFQKAHNLPQTGVVDKATFWAMNGK